ncbi:MFS transporter [Mycobacterium sp. CVI_P3]|uniref:MFS transporter n=1 Tax=Mycobacterium pinniadriaticum TaxID=2994102 RepID=A0ABT3SEB7_9MYCO|nr:MFS transporter [Mycobacterium pinniadriaticum]MCX2931437.1 MFS transporter [Mycobacterium pinniadriaticum]MCX2937861.1 MFS transporter [Mycobacterium pinniadriaticum]
MSRPPSVASTAGRSKVLAWALWDCGSTGMNAIVATFVFSVYLTSTVGQGLPGGTSPASWLGRALAIAGLTVAVVAPLIGVLVQAPHRRRAALIILSALAAVSTTAMSLIRAEPAYFAMGLVLLAFTAACGDLASVPYNAMLRQLTTPQNSGRISGIGAAAGYFGSVVLLMVIFTMFIVGSGADRGLLGIPVEDGQNVRAAMLMAAAWFVVLALPLLITAHALAPAPEPEPLAAVGLLGGYRRLWNDLRGEWRRDRNLVYYLIVSAIFRDGIAGVFAFGAVLGVSVYGISPANVLIFGVIASTMAALGAVLGGHIDDRIGGKPVIVASLTAMIAVGVTLLSLSGPVVFWVCGLLLAFCVGPVTTSARTVLLRMASHGKEGVAFGLYTMTGRAASFLAPWLFFVFVDAFHADRAGLGGLCVVLAVGLLGMLGVKVPNHARTG